ncbi:helix-turn-helix domain-containing protein [Kutzneria sp. CA-103260]|uniref:PucR family transcriptional regulator n=1 Tax=Kutzneria sp. CA-103260 TaxID=2802641 RepID=UPI001BA7A865|nr:PucR family transcriptional regulator [Kutzneria sp. CA-103260]QUQ68406.1 PucR family transcriptional regulator [Kutzneria sp. CA-103260]
MTAVRTDASQLWARVPSHLGARFRPYAGRLARDVVREIQHAVPAYARPLRGKFGQVLVGGVERAIVHCFDSVGNPRAESTEWTAWFRYVGRVEFSEGRGTESLQTAVRVGARVAWRNLSSAGRELGIPPDVLLLTAEAIFAYVDELCRVAVEGYAEARRQATAGDERQRTQLLRLILADPPTPTESIEAQALAADWPLPPSVAVIALTADTPAPADGLTDGSCILTAHPDQVVHRTAALLAVGPTVPLAQARQSLILARRAVVLAQRGVIAGPVVRCDDHLLTLLLHADDFLLDELSRRCLAPFAGLTPKQRERLSATLLAWLDTRGGVNEIAARLDVHPQTVRYRMHQIDRLAGHLIHDPVRRLELEIALRHG